MSAEDPVVEIVVEIRIAGRRWRVDAAAPVELAIPLEFGGDQPRAFGLPPARAHPVEAGGFVGDTRRGGSANCETLELTPHGNGTHTEGVGHLTRERISVADVGVNPLLPAAVLTASPKPLRQTDETYDGVCRPDDRVICRADLERARRQSGVDDAFLRTIALRIDAALDPLGDHSGTNPPYPTAEAIAWLREVGCEHLLVELPSVDRESDGGTLPNHHQFFGLRRGESPTKASRRRTITEMIAVPDEIDDGPFALSLQFPRFELDAAPSRPILYPLVPAEE